MPERQVIASSWRRVGRSGLRADAAPREDYAAVDRSRLLNRAAEPVLSTLQDDLAGAQSGILLADQVARIVDVRCGEPALAAAVERIGATVGMRFGEDTTGTTCLGTTVELRQGLAVRGPEHYFQTFRDFSCVGHPIVNPLTRRLEGVLNISTRASDDHPVFAALVRRAARDIERAVEAGSSRSHQRLMAEFDRRTRTFGPRREPALVAVADGVVVSSRAAVDLLGPADHVAVQQFAGELVAGPSRERRVALASGREARLLGTVPDGVTGALVEIVLEAPSSPSSRAVRSWPLLVTGETGTGRTTEARALLGPGRVEADALHALPAREHTWWFDLRRHLRAAGVDGVLVENVHLLSARLSGLLAEELRGTRVPVVLTAVPDAEAVAPALRSACVEQVGLTPLRLRRHDIPGLAEAMLLSMGRARLTPATLRLLAAQRWPGNLTELRRIVEHLAVVRSVGDIVPADLPSSHRGVDGPEDPRDRAEAELLLATLRGCGGNKQEAARRLGISRSTLYNRIRALHLAP
ncbi:helix-turn-helix domain-containing protein [Pseudonocardia sp. RS010]|uniref:helix-turn-helix domain-containing protein n=1 Tax=Pseudonocardia sp. RS010 TaxID=3385979 RepID=UPI00399F958B